MTRALGQYAALPQNPGKKRENIFSHLQKKQLRRGRAWKMLSFHSACELITISFKDEKPKNLIHLADDPFCPKCHCGRLATAALYQGRKSDIYYGFAENVMINSTPKSK